MISSGDGGCGVVDDYALSCVYGHLRGGQRDEVGDLDGAYAVVVDAEPLLPHPVYLLGVEHFDFLDEFVEHPGRQFAGAGVFADQRDKLDCQHFFRQIFLGYFSDIVQAFDTLRKNVCGDDYTSLHNPIVLSSVLPAYGMFHSIQILFL